MPKAIRVTKENIPLIVEHGRALGFALSYIADSKEYPAVYGEELYLITDGTQEKNNITFTTFWETDFFKLWKFVDEEHPTEFVEIQRA